MVFVTRVNERPQMSEPNPLLQVPPTRFVVIGRWVEHEEMADDLQRLGLYATSNDVRKARASLAEGVAHVRDYSLANVLAGIARQEGIDAERPPTPGTWGASALSGLEQRRDELTVFLDRWDATDA
jgi:hypothetical protein